ncbi:hypothetical protein GN244_ATG17781 [Phytophthora infestans]|uniref:Uncharacterized protein n=1 Tax=Phytophthora infestans TaxID=4787 RepID=A0A833W6C0_PHYIN|nr:hypothetical protein GN244_ATG17781 [Phytophthora infestans]
MASGVYGGCVGNIQIIRDLTPFVAKLMDDRALQPTNYASFLLSLCLVGAVVYRSLEGYSPATVEAALESDQTNGTQMSGSMATVGHEFLERTSTASDLPSLQGNSFTRLAQSLSIYNFAFMMTLNLLPLFVQLLKSNGGSSNTRRGGAIRNPTTFVTAPRSWLLVLK